MQEQLFPIPQGKLISEKISKRTANTGSYSGKILLYFSPDTFEATVIFIIAKLGLHIRSSR